MAAERKYEIRGSELYLNGERLPVSPLVVRAVIRRRTRETGPLSPRAPLDPETASRILKLERTVAITRLANLLRRSA
jgi:hypothetical protein